MELQHTLKNLQWTGQGSIRYKVANKIVYVDPYNQKNDEIADILLITHPHHDHLSMNDIKKIYGDKTNIFCPAEAQKTLRDKLNIESQILNPWDEVTVEDITIKAVPAYNLTKKTFHPKEKNWLGFVVSYNDISVYFAGDTERIPEMAKITCDIALLPLGQTYTMNSVEDAAQSAIDVSAKIAVPVHYGMFEGSNEDVEHFRELLKDKIQVYTLPLKDE